MPANSFLTNVARLKVLRQKSQLRTTLTTNNINPASARFNKRLELETLAELETTARNCFHSISARLECHTSPADGVRGKLW